MIRVAAICVFLHDEKILVKEFSDDGKIFYRPLGGGVEFGEHSADTVAREIKEEIGAAITLLEFLGVIEEITEFQGKPVHEIVFVYNARFVEPGLYNKTIHGKDGPHPIKAVWKNISFFRENSDVLYPKGLLELLMK